MRYEFSSLSSDEEFYYVNNNKYDKELVDRIIEQASDPFISNIVIDGFCGLGGVTEGFSKLPSWKVIACLNHWDTAIETHQKNHPDCLHLLEDFKTADLTILQFMIAEIKRRNPGVKVHLWLSLECTNFSIAKGGMSRDADSRTLADHADRYVIQLNPDTIWIENVKEFRLWGGMIPKCCIGVGKNKKILQFNPLSDDAKSFFEDLINNGDAPYCPLVANKKKKIVSVWMIPEKATLGRDFNRWRKHICSFGYQAAEKLLNCADYGIPQHRIRLIMQFKRIGEPVVYPQPTHDKKGRNGLPKWMPVKPCLDLDNEGESVLSFVEEKGCLVPRISSPKTIDRLIRGIEKQAFNKTPEETEFCTTITLTGGKIYLTKVVNLIDHYFGNGYMKSVNDPIGTTGTKDGAPLHTIQFLGTYHSVGDGTSLLQPSCAIETKDKYPLITAHFMIHEFSNGQTDKNIEEPTGAILQHPKQKIVSVDRFIMDTQFNNNSFSAESPCRTITANRKHFYVINFQWFNAGFVSMYKPCNTLIARQDKSPNYLLTLETGELAIEVFENDPPHYVRLKKFMAENGIVSINMRMLNEKEMLRIMTIPDTYHLSKSSTKNKKMIGNAVPSDLVMQLGKAYDDQQDYMTKQKVA